MVFCVPVRRRLSLSRHGQTRPRALEVRRWTRGLRTSADQLPRDGVVRPDLGRGGLDFVVDGDWVVERVLEGPVNIRERSWAAAPSDRQDNRLDFQ